VYDGSLARKARKKAQKAGLGEDALDSALFPKLYQPGGENNDGGFHLAKKRFNIPTCAACC
jgi:hypothetical protein